MFSHSIITTKRFLLNLGKKQIRIDTYKELFYLHPKYFHPDKNVLSLLNINKGERLILVRFVSWIAHHDRGQYGIKNKKKLIYALQKYGKVYISSEFELEGDLKIYKLNIPVNQIHDIIYFSDIFISDSQTMTTESAILGTPAIRCNSFVGKKDMSNFKELEEKYKLIYNVNDDENIMKIVNCLLSNEYKNQWRLKKDKFLENKIDPNEYIMNLIENL
jgi:predicted glycosyltransferase